MDRISALAIDNAGNLYISEGGRVRKVDTSGIITRVAGKGRPFGFSGDGGPATDAQTFGILGLAVDGAGNLYLNDSSNNRIRKVDTAGIITTVAGNGVFGFSGDGGLSTSAAIRNPDDISLDGAGNLYIADTNRIRKVSAGAAFSTSLSLMVFSYTVGGAIPASQTLTVTSTGAALTFTGSTSASWMALSPGGGTTPATLNVSVLPTGLAPGTYQGTITLNSSGATARTVNVTLRVAASGGPVTG
jgi:hypothetical protein